MGPSFGYDKKNATVIIFLRIIVTHDHKRNNTILQLSENVKSSNSGMFTTKT